MGNLLYQKTVKLVLPNRQNRSDRQCWPKNLSKLANLPTWHRSL